MIREWSRNDVAFKGYTVAKERKPSPYEIAKSERAANRQWKAYLAMLSEQWEHEQRLARQAESFIAKLSRGNAFAVAFILADIFREMQDPDMAARYKSEAVRRLAEVLGKA